MPYKSSDIMLANNCKSSRAIINLLIVDAGVPIESNNKALSYTVGCLLEKKIF